MNSLPFSSLFFVLLFAATTSSFSRFPLNLAHAGTTISPAIVPVFFPPAESGFPAKQRALEKDSTVLTRVTTYQWNGFGWDSSGNTKYTYDTEGRLVGYSTTNKISPDYIQTTTVENNLRPGYQRYTTCLTVPSLSIKSKTVQEFFFSTQTTSDDPTRTLFLNFNFDMALKAPITDSLLVTSFNFDTSSGVWETIGGSPVFYKWVKNNGKYFEIMKVPDGPADSASYEILQIKGLDGRIDSIVVLYTSTGSAPSERERVIYLYGTTGQLSVMAFQERDLFTGVFRDKMKIQVTSTSGGQITSYEVIQYDSDSGRLVNTLKYVYFYGTTPIASVHQPRKTAPKNRITIGSIQGNLRIRSSSPVFVGEITLFDLTGRVICHYAPRRTIGSGETLTLPERGSSGGMTMVRITTDREVLVLALKR